MTLKDSSVWYGLGSFYVEILVSVFLNIMDGAEACSSSDQLECKKLWFVSMLCWWYWIEIL